METIKKWKCTCGKKAEEFSLCNECEAKNKLTAFLEPDIVNFIKEVEITARQEERERTLQEVMEKMPPGDEKRQYSSGWQMYRNIMLRIIEEVKNK